MPWGTTMAWQFGREVEKHSRTKGSWFSQHRREGGGARTQGPTEQVTSLRPPEPRDMFEVTQRGRTHTNHPDAEGKVGTIPQLPPLPKRLALNSMAS